MGRGDSFSPQGLRGAWMPARVDRFNTGLPVASGTYPRKGKGWGQQGAPRVLDGVAQWNKDQLWSSWRRGLSLAGSTLFRSTEAYQAVTVLRLPAFAPQGGFQPAPALLVGFAAQASPEGRWTVAIKPRGSEISPVAVPENGQRDVVATLEDGTAVPLLVVELPGAWPGGGLAAGSALIGELIEDSATSATELATGDEEDDAALLLMCVAVYPSDGVMVFDGSRCWRRQRSAGGGRVLVEQQRQAGDAGYRFRVGRHLTQSTVVSCNCPSHLGVEYGRLREGGRLGRQALYPQHGPLGIPDQVQLPLRDAVDRLLRLEPETRVGDPLEGVARRFAALDWRRRPEECCKHCHAVRFALGVPVAEPSDVPVMIGDWQDAQRGLMEWEGGDTPLAAPQFIERLNARSLADSAFRELGSTITTGAIGDAWGVTVEKIALLPAQVDGALGGGGAYRFLQQQMGVEPAAAEQALTGDVWAGRLTNTISYPFLSGGVLLEEPFYAHRQEAPAVLG